MTAIKASSVREVDLKALHELAEWQKPAHKTTVQDCKTLFISEPDVLLLDTYSKQHSLLLAVLTAYNQHTTLQLKPDDIWLTIAQGIAQHINADNNAEKFRSKFVAHEGKKELRVKQVDIPDYNAFVQEICSQIEQEVVDPTLQRALVCDFSTTTPAALTASKIVTMAAMEKYFDYGLYMCCVIPSVILEGSLEDWEHILEKVDLVQDLGLELDWWLNELKPVLQKLIDTYKGQPNEDFWSRIITCHPYGSGSQEYYSGWIVTFFPYNRSGYQRRNVTEKIKDNQVPQAASAVQFKTV